MILAQKDVPGQRPGDDDPLLPHHRKELEEGSGLSAATIAEIGFYSASPIEAAGLLNWPKPNPDLGHALVTPYPGTDGHVQLKFDRPRKNKDGNEIKYESPVGSIARLFVPPDALDAVTTTTDDLVITEGAKKASKATQEGVITVSVDGVWKFKVRGEERLIPDLEAIDWDGRKVTIVYDSDAATNPSVRNAAAALAALLEAAGAEVKALFLPPGPNGEKVGMDDFLLAHPVEELEALIAGAGPPASIEDAGRIKAGVVDPEDLADLVLTHTAVEGVPGLRMWNDVWYRWRDNRWEELSDREAKGLVLRTLKPHHRGIIGSTISNTVMHLESGLILPRRTVEGDWVAGGVPPGLGADADVFPAANGLLDLAAVVDGLPRLLDHTPRRFGTWVSPVPFNPAAPRPDRFLAFLHEELLPGRPEEARLLKQFAGYCLSRFPRHHKALLLVGPPRSGKGTFLWVLQMLLGPDAVSAERLGNLGGRFALQQMVGKRLLAIGDVRLPPTRAGRCAPVETLLSITGEDALTVDRKNKEPIVVRLPLRVALASNELPSLEDASGAVARRFMPVQLTNDFYGQEDVGLKDKLTGELPGILNWALAGLADLHAEGRFAEPTETVRLRGELELLSSPIKAFVVERCVLGANEAVPTEKLREEYAKWAGSRGLPTPEASEFGRKLTAAIPGVDNRQKRDRGTGKKPPHYFGIGLA